MNEGDLKPGMLVRIKEIPGTKLASKRKPLWGEIRTVGTPFRYKGRDWRHLRVEIFNGPDNHGYRHLDARNVDIPTDKQVPDWVWVEIAKRRLME